MVGVSHCPVCSSVTVLRFQPPSRVLKNRFPLHCRPAPVRDAEDDKVEALEAGADDYITKPFRIKELAARIRTAVRLHRAVDSPSESPIVIGCLMLDPVRRNVERSGRKIRLTLHEFDALHLLSRRRVVQSRTLVSAQCFEGQIQL